MRADCKPNTPLLLTFSLPTINQNAFSYIGRYVHESSIEKPEVHNPVRRYFSFVEKPVYDNVATAQQQGELSTSSDAEAISKLILSSIQGGYIFARAYGRANALSASMTSSKKLLDALALEKNV